MLIDRQRSSRARQCCRPPQATGRKSQMSAAQLAKTTNGKPNTSDNRADELGTTEFDARVEANRRRLAAELQPSYDFIVCGSGSSGSVVARRLAESGRASVLLLEAGGTDDVPSVREARQWLTNFGTERHWNFQAEPNPLLNGRRLPLNMGKVLGGSSSINGMIWSRGHKNDWDYFAGEAGDPGWNYESVLGIYRRIEDWQGTPDPQRRGKGGLVYVEPARDPNPMAPAMLEAVRFLGIPTFDDQNGEMMEGEGGAAITNLRIRDGRRLSVFRTYTYPYMDRSNLAVLTGALVTRVVFDGKRAVGVEFLRGSKSYRIAARREIVLSLGAINTPRVLMQSGIGDGSELTRAGVDVVQHLPGVGRNFTDHILVPCVWELEPPSRFGIMEGRRPSSGRAIHRSIRRICSRYWQRLLLPLQRLPIFCRRSRHGRCSSASFARIAEDTCASPGQVRLIPSRLWPTHSPILPTCRQ